MSTSFPYLTAILVETGQIILVCNIIFNQVDLKVRVRCFLRRHKKITLHKYIVYMYLY